MLAQRPCLGMMPPADWPQRLEATPHPAAATFFQSIMLVPNHARMPAMIKTFCMSSCCADRHTLNTCCAAHHCRGSATRPGSPGTCAVICSTWIPVCSATLPCTQHPLWHPSDTLPPPLLEVTMLCGSSAIENAFKASMIAYENNRRGGAPHSQEQVTFRVGHSEDRAETKACIYRMTHAPCVVLAPQIESSMVNASPGCSQTTILSFTGPHRTVHSRYSE